MKTIVFTTLCVLLATSLAFANRHAVVNDGITRTGDILQLAIPLSALAYSSAIGDWEGVKQLAYVVGATIITTQALKYTIREERPYQSENSKGHTFPSGHTSSAFAGAGFWQMRYGWYIGVPMYAAAAFVGYSRNHAKMHNWLDIATGAAVGIGFNLLFTSRYNNEDTQLSITPTDGGAMFRLNVRF
jgi:membrane-associated phospholipid phosphatase